MPILQDLMEFAGKRLYGEERYRHKQYKRAQRLAQRHGYEVYGARLIWRKEPSFAKARDEADRRGLIGIPNDRCYFLQRMAMQVRDVAGDVAECGVRHGRSSFFILSGLGPASTKQYHIFDSFEGLSSPGAGDEEQGQSAWQAGQLAVAEDHVRANLADYAERLHFHRGWIPSRFADVGDKRFVFVHVDVDLHEPTRDSVEFFYPRLVPGGVLIFDDYGSELCPGAKKAIDEFVAGKPEKLIVLPTGQALIVKNSEALPQ